MPTDKKSTGAPLPTLEPSFEDFHALVRRKMIENGEDPDAVELDALDPLDFTDDEWVSPWIN